MSPVKERKHVPDILECLAQLSSDEVPTPPKLANAMLDLVPDEVWTDPNLKWLDPCTKSGVFLREIVKRLLFEGLVNWEPDFEKRREHIFRNMIYGCGITELTGIISRRTVYCSRHAAGDLSVVKFEDDAGNIPFVRAEHTFKDGRCTICGAPEDLERGEDRENYAYAFIHDAYPTKEMEDMKFDVIVGNPPYQIGAEGTTRTMPIYQEFVKRAVEMNPQYALFITPSRWFTGGLGLDEYRDQMINDRRLVKLVDNPKIFDCFPQAKIRGGVSYFLWDRDHDGDCEVSTRVAGTVISSATRDLRAGCGVLIRDNRASGLVEKVMDRSVGTIENWVQPRLAFSQFWRTNYRGESAKPFPESIPLIHNRGIGYVSPASFERNLDLVPRWKVLVPMASSGDTPVDDEGNIVDVVLGAPIAVAPGSACTESYFIVGVFDSESECENYAHYLCTKFVRILVLQRKATQHLTPARFRFVPTMDMSRRWTDEDLYEYFGLTEEEANYVDATIKPRSVNLSLDSPIPTSHLPGGAKHRAAAA